MKEKMKEYETPLTEKVQVETEGNFCGSASINNPNDEKTGQIESHEVNQDFGYEFEDKDWD